MILDLIVALSLVFSAYVGYKKGLTTLLVNLIGFFVAIVLAYMLKSSIVDFVIEKTNVDTYMQQMITEGMDKALESKTSNKDDSKTFYEGLVENMDTTQTVDNVSKGVVRLILETAAFIAIFICVNICTFIIKMLLNLVFDLPILSTINNVGGLVAGGVMGLFRVWIILAVLSIFVPMIAGLKPFIDSTVLTKALYDTNAVLKLLSAGLNINV